MKERLWEIDALRGIAIVMMLLSNFLFDLFIFKDFVQFYEGFWFYFARATATFFLLVAGISLTLSYARKKTFSHFLRRGVKIFSCGLLITAVTWFFFPEGMIFFGILHLIGLSVILAYPFLRLTYLNLVVSSLVILAGMVIEEMQVNFPLLVWFYPQQTSSVDYTPILPWFGVVVLGIFMGKAIFPSGKRKYSIPDVSAVKPIRLLMFLGRHSLAIYLLHQPLFLAVIFLIRSIQ